MKNSLVYKIALLGSLVAAQGVNAKTTGTWGAWGTKANLEDNFIATETLQEAEFHQTQMITPTLSQGFSAAGTQLEGTPFQGLDTGDGIPTDLAGLAAGGTQLEGTPFEGMDTDTSGLIPVDLPSSLAAGGTQLEGTLFEGTDTDPIELNEDGIPIDLGGE